MNGPRSSKIGTCDLAMNANLATPLALRPKDAAKAIGIGQRKLWELTSPRGPIPCVRVGCCVLYPYHLLQAWLAEQAAKGSDAPKPEGGAA